MDEDDYMMAPTFASDGSEQHVDEEDSRQPITSSVSIENDTSWLAGGSVGYHLQVHNEDGTRWVCVRRYSEFATLREVLVTRCQQPSRRSALLALAFPEKRWLGSADLDTVKERRRELERWINGAITVCPTDADVMAFLSPSGPREAGLMTPGGSGSFSSTSGGVGSDAEDWAELEKVRQLRESLLRSQMGERDQSDPSGILPNQLPAGSELEPEPEPGSARMDEDLLEMLIREAEADAELDSNFSLPLLRDSIVAAKDADDAPPSTRSSVRDTVAADLSHLETPPRPANHDVTPPFNVEVATPLQSDQDGAARKPAQAYHFEKATHDVAGYEHLLSTGGNQSLEAVCDVLDRVVPLLDVPQKHTPRRRRRLLEDRVEKLLEQLRPTESGAGLQQRWAAAAALMQLEPNVASRLAGGLAELASLPTQSAYAGYSGLSAAAIVTLASVLRILELAAAGRSTGNLLEQEVLNKLTAGGENAVACVAAALDHCLALVDIPQAGISRRYRRALEHDILEAQSCLERGLGLKITGRGLQPPLLDALTQAIVSVQQLVPSELLNSDAVDAAGSPLQAAVEVMSETVSADEVHAKVAVDGILSDKARLDSNENSEEGQMSHQRFAAMQRLLRLLVRPDTDHEVMYARKEEARVTQLRVVRRREQRITAVLARKSWGAADDDDAAGSALPAATEKLRVQQEEEASAMRRMRLLEAKEEMKDKQKEKEARQARLALNRQRRARRARRRRQLWLCAIASAATLAFAFRSNPAALQRVRAVTEPVENKALAIWGRVHVLLGPSVDRLRATWGRVHVLLGPSVDRLRAIVDPVMMPALRKLQPAAYILRTKLQVGVELWAWMIDGLVHACLRAVPALVLLGQTGLKMLRLRVLLPGAAVVRQGLAKILRQ